VTTKERRFVSHRLACWINATSLTIVSLWFIAILSTELRLWVGADDVPLACCFSDSPAIAIAKSSEAIAKKLIPVFMIGSPFDRLFDVSIQ
jgi:hypothetical protein